jgi:hypothetical protein
MHGPEVLHVPFLEDLATATIASARVGLQSDMQMAGEEA